MSLRPHGTPIHAQGYAAKRYLDLVLSALALVLTGPLQILIAIVVRATSPGPALFKQSRVGQLQETFTIYKYRTMYERPSVNQFDDETLAAPTDSRITRVGRVLRSTSLDELPQLINILKGDMSLVGPRPLIPDQLAAIPENRFERFRVKPGLTGYAQVRGRRSLDWLDQLQADCEYARNTSLLTDMRIILRTAQVVISRQDIYGSPGKNWRAYVADGNSGSGHTSHKDN